MPGSSVLHYFSEFAQIQVFWVSDANTLILCLPLLHLPSIFPSIRVFVLFCFFFFLFPHKSVLCIRWPKYWNFSFSISPSNVYSGFISFRVDWFDLAVQGVLNSLLQQHSSKASILWILWCLAFFMDKSSHSYMTTGINIGLTAQTFVGKGISLLFNTLSWFVIDFLPKSNCLLISWLQSPSTLMLEPKKIKPVTASTFSPSICHEMMRPDATILVFECWISSPLFFLFHQAAF